MFMYKYSIIAYAYYIWYKESMLGRDVIKTNLVTVAKGLKCEVIYRTKILECARLQIKMIC